MLSSDVTQALPNQRLLPKSNKKHVPELPPSNNQSIETHSQSKTDYREWNEENSENVTLENLYDI